MKTISLTTLKQLHPHTKIQVLFCSGQTDEIDLNSPITIETFEEEVMGMRDWRKEEEDNPGIMNKPTIKGMLIDGEYEFFCIINNVIWLINKD